MTFNAHTQRRNIMLSGIKWIKR